MKNMNEYLVITKTKALRVLSVNLLSLVSELLEYTTEDTIVSITCCSKNVDKPSINTLYIDGEI